MDPLSWLMMAALALCVALSAFFSVSETAFLAMNRIRVKTLARDGDRRAALALRLADEYDRLLTTIVVGNNLVNIIATAVATVLFTRLMGDIGPTVATAVMTILILFFGEISPKTLATQFADSIAMAVAGPLSVLTRLLTPVNKLFSAWKRFLNRVFKPKEDEVPIEEELMTMVDEAQHEGDIDAHEGQLFHSVIEFIDQDALDIMTPRVDVIALPDTATMDEAEAKFRETGYSRLPVYHENLDHVIGVLNQKDFYAARHAAVTDIRTVMAPAVYAPSTLQISKLLRLCQSTRTHLVVVLDEFGGTEGIVTIEDVLEELVGEIYDETDDEVNEDIVTLPDGSLQVDGSVQLAELLEKLHLTDEWEADTVGGWVSELLGRIPNVGASFDVAGYHGVVSQMDRRRVTRVTLSRPEPAPDPEDDHIEETA